MTMQADCVPITCRWQVRVPAFRRGRASAVLRGRDGRTDGRPFYTGRKRAGKPLIAPIIRHASPPWMAVGSTNGGCMLPCTMATASAPRIARSMRRGGCRYDGRPRRRQHRRSHTRRTERPSQRLRRRPEHRPEPPRAPLPVSHRMRRRRQWRQRRGRRPPRQVVLRTAF